MRTAWLSMVAVACLGLTGCGVDASTASDAPGATDVTVDAGSTDGQVASPDVSEVSGSPDASADVVPDVAVDVSGPDLPPDISTCPESAPCDDADPCTTGDVCDAAGECAGVPMACDDALDCTADRCADGVCLSDLKAGFCLDDAQVASVCVDHNAPRPGNACELCDAQSDGGPGWLTVADGALCDDGDVCTTGDRCELGLCKGTQSVVCEPDGVCFDAACEPGVGCVQTANAVACDDGDRCTGPDVCAEGVCVGETVECDDEDACTLETCDPYLGCLSAPSDVCVDDDPCTADTCDSADGACTHEAFVGPCEDGDLCTEGEVCDDGGTCSGGVDKDCVDQTECTEDSCDSAVGCQHFFVEGSCDDGEECTVNDFCAAGSCIGYNESCDPCDEPVSDHASKIVTLNIGESGLPGFGLDVDGDLATCEPLGSCGGGIDNILSILAPFVNDGLDQTLEAGTLIYVMDLNAATFDGAPFAVPVYDTDALDPFCDFQTEVCPYEANQVSFAPDCQSYFVMPGVTIEGTTLSAGGPGTVLSMVLPIAPGVVLPLTIANGRVSASITFDPESPPDSPKILGLAGVIAGAVPKQQLIDTVIEFPENVLPLPTDLVVGFLEGLDNDIDADGDGVDDSVSIGITFTSIPGTLAQN